MIAIEKQAVEQAKRLLQEVTGESVTAVSPPPGMACDFILHSGPLSFLIEAKQASSAASVYWAAKRLRRLASEYHEKTRASSAVVPLLVVPYMGEAGRRLCEEEGLSWFDLSGNANIRAPGLRILISGQRNQFKKRGRKATPFAPQASRLARQFLIGHPRHYTQKDLVELTGLDQGFVSRVLRSLEKERLVSRQGRLFEVVNRSLLLDSWQEAYDFEKHQIVKGHIPARSSEDLLLSLSHAFYGEGLLSAATGLAGAWLLTHFASFRLVTLYLPDTPPQQLLANLGFREEEKGANVWLVIPNDTSVFAGRQERDGLLCVHPVQVYLDLKFHPERASEAAERVRNEYLRGKDHAKP
jgi:hypothetical protein